MKTIAVCNHKGGSGKTTTCVNLAAALGEKGKTTLVIDLDAQCSATRWHGADLGQRGLYDAFTDEGDLADLIEPAEANGVGIIPSSAMMAGVEKALAGEIGAETILRRKLEVLQKVLQERASNVHWEPETVSTTDYLKYGSGDPKKVWRAKYKGSPPEEQERMRARRRRKDTERARATQYDYAILDCPPAMGTLQVNALTAAQRVIVPVEAHFMALVGLSQVLETVKRVQERINPDLELGGILACRVDTRTRHGREVVESLRDEFDRLVFQTVIRENVRLAECAGHQRPITAYDPRSAGASDYRALAQEVLERLG